MLKCQLVVSDVNNQWVSTNRCRLYLITIHTIASIIRGYPGRVTGASEELSREQEREVFLVLGDFGAGKSTFGRHLENEH